MCFELYITHTLSYIFWKSRCFYCNFRHNGPKYPQIWTI